MATAKKAASGKMYLRNRYNKQNWWLVRHGAVINIKTIRLPKEMTGKKVRIRIETTGEDKWDN